MKRFIRTIPGKITMFLLCVLCLSMLCGSFVGAVFMLDNGRFYTRSREEIVNTYMENALMSSAYEYVWTAVNKYPSLEYPGLIAEVLDDDGTCLFRSSEADDETVWEYSLTFGIQKDNKGNITDTYYLTENNHDTNAQCKVNISLNRNCSVFNPYLMTVKVIHAMWALRYAIYGIFLLSLAGAAASFTALMRAAGRRPDTEELFPGPFNRVPFDLLLVCWGGCAIAAMAFCECFWYDWMLFLCGLVLLALLCLTILLCMGAAVRIKQHSLWKNTLLRRLVHLARRALRRAAGLLRKFFRFIGEILRCLPLVWRTALVLAAIAFLELGAIVCFRRDPGFLFVLCLVEKLILIPAALYIALCLRRLQQSGRALAAGNLSYVTDTARMPWDLKEHGENLNSIAGGMAIAVESRLKSERMKTELITNVSHDIKTPLTSIINYTVLIGKEPCDNPKITEYSEVLLRQSERLRRLIDDLVEASKASTGNLELHPMPCDAAVFLTQAAGEYEEKMRQAGLNLITSRPEQEIRIMADGRRMWRIFDNLMNNICKYAQNGTRVYLSLEQHGSDAVIIFRNTSREPLNMTAEELMERFARGDASRSTEGNGLGLSIAKSLAELHGGSLSLAIDGDLFKAILRFPAI